MALGFPGGNSGKEPACQCRRHKRCRSGKTPWRRSWQPSPIFLSGESHWQRSLGGYSPWSSEELDRVKWLSMHAWMTLATFSGQSYTPVPLLLHWARPRNAGSKGLIDLLKAAIQLVVVGLESNFFYHKALPFQSPCCLLLYLFKHSY